MSAAQADPTRPAQEPGALAHLLRDHRRRALLTQEELADRSGVSVSTIAGLEAGRTRRPRIGSVRLLAEALNLDQHQRAALLAAGRADLTRPPDRPDNNPRGGIPATGAGGSDLTGPTARAAGPARPVPQQLPADLAAFTGRADYLARLDALLPSDDRAAPGAVVIAAIAGTAGVGKTTLALHWSHRVAGQFPDGQLYANLRGFDPAAPPTDPSEAIRGFLRALGVPPDQIPVDLDGQVTLYRTQLAGRRMLVVLDNARDADQVRPLLPGSGGCLVVVTSRSELTGLVAAAAAYPITLDLLPAAESRQLLARRLGAGRVAAEPTAVGDIIAECAGLPLALAVVAARAATHPGFPLARSAEELRTIRGGLDALTTGDATTDLRAVFSWSYDTLRPPAARLFRLLGLHPGTDIGTAAAASLAGLPSPQIRLLLAELTRAHLVIEPVPDRFAMHDLLRCYAAELVDTLDPAAERRAATDRMLAHYLHTAYAAARLLNPYRVAIPLAPAPPGVAPERIGGTATGPEAILAWFAAEQTNLLAAVGRAAETGWDAHTWQLAWALTEFLERRGLWHDQITIQNAAIAATRRLGDQASEALAHRFLGGAYIHLGEPGPAESHLRAALAGFDALADHHGQATTHIALARLHEQDGRLRAGLEHASRAAALYQLIGHRAGHAGSLNAVGWMHARLGEVDEALAFCRRALALHGEIGNRAGQADAWDSLGYAHHRRGDHPAAIECFQQSVAGFRKAGSRRSEAESLVNLGDAYRSLGDLGTARYCWQQAVAILREVAPGQAEQVRRRLLPAGPAPG